MSQNTDSNNLYSEFLPASKADWEELIKKDLGDDSITQLHWDTGEGFGAFPFFTRQELNHTETRPITHTAGWTICESIFDDDPTLANNSIKQAIKGGAEACLIRTGPSATEKGEWQTRIESPEDADKLLDGIDKPGFQWIFDCKSPNRTLLNMIEAGRLSGHSCTVLMDPFIQTDGSKSARPVNEFNRYSEFYSNNKSILSLSADGSQYRQNGASIIHELGLTLAIASEYIARAGTDAAGSIVMRLGTGPLYFPEIAKFRAARILWNNLLDAYSINQSVPLTIFAETILKKTNTKDPYTQLLRSVTEAMSAILGGANIVAVQPYDQQENKPTELSKRLARNIQHILREEAWFGKVADPAAGSYYIEQLTTTITEKSWKYFQTIEKQGGFLKALERGAIPEVNQ